MQPFSLFASTAPGLEPLLERELREMGIVAKAEAGGAAWQGGLEQMYEANLRSRISSRVTLRIAEFRARAFYELERHADRVEWERFVLPGAAVRLRVTSGKSKLYHESAIAERILTAITARVGGIVGDKVPAADEEDAERAESTVDDGDATVGLPTSGGTGGSPSEAPEASGQMFVVRFHRDRCMISADSSGELLHRRGYRLAVAKAPLRETLACAMLRAAGWDADAPLLDPFCGAGTIPIEAALAARRIAPGLARAERVPRSYAFESWAEHDAGLWARVVERARSEILPGAPVPIIGSDRDAGAIEAAHSNAARAGVAADIELSERTLSAAAPPSLPGGWLVTNPPYGLRVGERDRLRNLYAALGRFGRERLPGWTIAYLSADPRLDAQTGIALEEAVRTRNGGIPVRVVVGRV